MSKASDMIVNVKVSGLGAHFTIESAYFGGLRVYGKLGNQYFNILVEHHDYWLAFFSPSDLGSVAEWLSMRRKAMIAIYDQINEYCNKN